MLLLFVAELLGCVALGLPTLLALGVGYVLFFAYGLYRKHTAGAILKMSLKGIKTVQNVLIPLLLIGMMTGLWRSAGTIPAIVYYASGLIRPTVVILMSFLLNCLVSVLTGTSFGTSATMGVICMSVAMSVGASPLWTGGAILAGAFFGDRCSPVSTSALLVAELTGTDLLHNIRGMLRTCIVPFLISCALYAGVGLLGPHGGGGVAAGALFARSFRMGWVPLLPALVVLTLALCRVKVRIAILVSVLTAFAVGFAYQGQALSDLAAALLTGYRTADPVLAPMLNGGGLRSMVQPCALVCLSSCFAGIFEGTGLLNGLKDKMSALSRRTSPYFCVLAASVLTAVVSCNQTLAAMLTHQLCRDLGEGEEQLALDLENTVIVIAPLVPWSIACAVPLAAVGAPAAAAAAACYLYLLPLWNLLTSRRRNGEPGRGETL